VAGYRIARAARRDIESIRAESNVNWGAEAERRYAALLMDAIRRVTSDPLGRSTRDRSDLKTGLRSFHLRHVRREGRGAVKKPVHLLIYRQTDPDLIEIVRILHERMDPARHLPSSADE
jgi:toxin ParE1/3/4